MSTPAKKHRLFIVGGKGKNIPPWIRAAFDCEQFDQEEAKTRTLEPEVAPDAIVVLSSWVGHEHFFGARDLAEKLNIPMILSPGGWSASLKGASDLGVDWFIKDIDQARHHQATAEDATAIEDFIDNAWREAYNREWTARQALERRFSQGQKKLERLQAALDELASRDEAAQRVVEQVRSAAAEQRKLAEQQRLDAQARSERVAAVLVKHIATARSLLEELSNAVSLLTAAASSVSALRIRTEDSITELEDSLTRAEDDRSSEESAVKTDSDNHFQPNGGSVE